MFIIDSYDVIVKDEDFKDVMRYISPIGLKYRDHIGKRMTIIQADSGNWNINFSLITHKRFKRIVEDLVKNSDFIVTREDHNAVWIAKRA